MGSDYAPNHDEVLLELAGARNYNAWLFGRALPYLGTSVLDVGAGIGTFTELAAARASTVVALEPDPAFAERLAARFGDRRNVEVVNGDLAEAPAQGFDSIICFNVLEHIRDDGEALRRFRDLLRPGGHLLLLVPAHASLWSPFDEAVGHERRYDRRSLEQILRQSGLTPTEVTYVNPVGGARLARLDAAPAPPHALRARDARLRPAGAGPAAARPATAAVRPVALGGRRPAAARRSGMTARTRGWPGTGRGRSSSPTPPRVSPSRSSAYFHSAGLQNVSGILIPCSVLASRSIRSSVGAGEEALWSSRP